MCGDCCQGFGGTYVDEKDVAGIAGYLGTTPEAVKEKWCVPTGGKMVLAQDGDGYCVFWDKVCTIHEVKPRMCRRWPYIPVLLSVPENWRAMASMCPGINPEAPPEAVAEAVRRQLAAEEGDGSGK